MVKDILAIGGHPGLFKMITQAKNGIIVESLVDGKRMPTHATSKISALEDISIYTEMGDVPLSEVFISIFEKGLNVDPKSDAATLKSNFEKVVADYDSDRVYTSDMKKVFAWYKLLSEKGLISAEIIEKYKAKVAEEKKEDAEIESEK